MKDEIDQALTSSTMICKSGHVLVQYVREDAEAMKKTMKQKKDKQDRGKSPDGYGSDQLIEPSSAQALVDKKVTRPSYSCAYCSVKY